jgi:DNA polymerase-3 subunit gamma/tau
VVEIDAASHNGVDDARDLRERAVYAPVRDQFKVFILDEAHMVTNQGFNALLKLVEEPPPHVKFVFATTEPEKVIGTIRSRTHHYPFRLVAPGTMLDYMEHLCGAESIQPEPGVLPLVVKAGGGSVRDSESVLDQLMAGSHDGVLTYSGAVALLGFTPENLLEAMVEALARSDGGAALRVIDSLVESGGDPRRFVEDFLERLRDLIVLAAAGDGALAALRSIPPDALAGMREQAVAMGMELLSRAADVVNAGLTQMTGATSPRLQVELLVPRMLVAAHGVRRPEPGTPLAHQVPGGREDPRRLSAGSGASGDTRRESPAVPQAGTGDGADGPSASAPAMHVPQGMGQPDPPPRPDAGIGPDSWTPDEGVWARSGAPTDPAVPPRPAVPPQPAVRPQPATPSPGARPDPAPAGSAAVAAWPKVLGRLRGPIASIMRNNATLVRVDGTTWTFGFDGPGPLEFFRRPHSQERLTEAATAVLGIQPQFVGTQAGAGGAGAQGALPAASPRPTPVPWRTPADVPAGGGPAPTAPPSSPSVPPASAPPMPSLPAAQGPPAGRDVGPRDPVPPTVPPEPPEPPSPPASTAPASPQPPAGEFDPRAGDSPAPDDQDAEAAGLIGASLILQELGGEVISTTTNHDQEPGTR